MTLELLSQGLLPADVPLSELCQRMGVTKGSFYAHFPDGVGELHQEIIGRWARDNCGAVLDSALNAVRDPLDRLRLLRARGLDTAQRDGTMRRWAARDPAAAAAVAAADHAVTARARKVLHDLGFAGSDAAVLAEVLVHAFVGANHTAAAPPSPDPAKFETLLEILCRAASGAPLAVEPGNEVGTAAGAAQDELILFMIPKDLPPQARDKLRRQAQQLVREQRAEVRGLSAAGPGERPADTSQGAGA